MTVKSMYKVINSCNLQKGDIVFDIGVGTLKLLSLCASITETDVYGNEIAAQFEQLLKHFDTKPNLTSSIKNVDLDSSRKSTGSETTTVPQYKKRKHGVIWSDDDNNDTSDDEKSRNNR